MARKGARKRGRKRLGIREKILSILNSQGGRARIGARRTGFASSHTTRELSKMINEGILKQVAPHNGAKKLSAKYELVKLPGTRPSSKKRRVNGAATATDELFALAMGQLETAKTTQNQLIAILEENQKLRSQVAEHDKKITELEEEIQMTDRQLGDEQAKLMRATIRDMERNQKHISQLSRDGRHVAVIEA